MLYNLYLYKYYLITFNIFKYITIYSMDIMLLDIYIKYNHIYAYVSYIIYRYKYVIRYTMFICYILYIIKYIICIYTILYI